MNKNKIETIKNICILKIVRKMEVAMIWNCQSSHLALIVRLVSYAKWAQSLKCPYHEL